VKVGELQYNMYGGDEVSALVIDVGSCNVKGGFAGEDVPKAVFPSHVGVIYSTGHDNTVGSGPKAAGEEADSEVKPEGGGEGSSARNVQYSVGTNSIYHPKPFMEIENPFENGLVTNWDIMEQLWDHTFQARVRVDPSQHPLLLAEPSFNNRQTREKSTEIMFEKYKVPALFISKNAVLTSFSTSKATSLVLDSGGGTTSAVPVHEGYALRKGIITSPLGGNKLTDELRKSLERKGISIKPSFMITRKPVHNPANKELVQFEVKLKDCPNTTSSYTNYMIGNVVQDMKEVVCRITELPYDENDTANSSVPRTSYELPDGNNVEIGHERFLVPELMFNPASLNTEGSGSALTGVHQMIYDSVSSCDADIRRELFNNVLVTGGNSLLPGFHERLLYELGEILPQQHPSKLLKVLSTANTMERKFSVWIGGSILASLGSFQQMWISKAEYEEHGRSIVERKCP